MHLYVCGLCGDAHVYGCLRVYVYSKWIDTYTLEPTMSRLGYTNGLSGLQVGRGNAPLNIVCKQSTLMAIIIAR